MKRADAKRHDSHKPEPTQPAVPTGAPSREIPLSLDRDALLDLMQDSLERHAAAKRVWGQNGVIQLCQVDKKRNVKAHVPEKHHAELERRLSVAYHETDYATARASLEGTARWLERINPDAASSLREGHDETLTVVRLVHEITNNRSWAAGVHHSPIDRTTEAVRRPET